MSRIPCLSKLGLLCSCLLLLSACGGAGGDERQTTGVPVPTTFTTLTIGTATQGDLITSTEEDYFKIPLTAGKFYSLEVFAARLKQTEWDTTNNVPLLRLYKPSSPGTMDLFLEHDYSGSAGTFGWFYFNWGKHDLDIPLFRAPTTGDYYILLSNDNSSRAGSNYVVRLKNMADPTAFIDNTADNTNSAMPTDPVPAGALVLNSPANVYDHYTTGTSNYYQINVVSTSPTDTALVCFELTAFRNGRFNGNTDYFDPTLILWDDLLRNKAIVDGSGDFAIDDYYFSDPSFCYNLKAKTYWLEVVENKSTGSGNYFLNYTFSDGITFIGETEGAGGTGITNNDSSTTELMMNYGDTHIGNLSGTDPEDWYPFTAKSGDLIQLQLFDQHNASGTATATDGADGTVRVEFRAPGGAQVLAASGPSEVATGTFEVTGPGAYTIRSLANKGSGTYYVRVTRPPAGTDTNYVFKLERFKAASDAVGFETVEQDNTTNNSPAGAQLVDPSGYTAAGDISPLNDIDYFTFPVALGKLVTINVYAKDTMNSGSNTLDKVHDLSGFGSTLEPILKVYRTSDDSLSAQADYYPGVGTVTAESITSPRPTLSTSFIATGTDYYFSIASSGAFGGGQTYFAEVIIE